MKTLMCAIVAAVPLLVTAAKSDEWYKATGGELRLSPESHGVFVFANAQQRIPVSALEPVAAELADLLQYRIEVRTIEGAVPLAEAPKRLAELKASGAVFIVDDPTIPTVILTAPEGKWALLNVAALAADGSKGRWLARRLPKEAWRAFGYLNGGGEAECLMSPVFSLKQLDALKAQAISPGPMGQIEEHLLQAGMKPVLRGTYLSACKEGWAPAPTNDIQKAIWDKVHQLPDQPLKIKFDPAQK